MRLPCLLLLCGMLPTPASGPEPFVAIPKERSAEYRIDFARNFFADAEAEKADRASLQATLAALEELKGRVASSAATLERALELKDRADVGFHRHSSYLYLRYAVDTASGALLAGSSELDAELERRTAFLREELMRIDDDAFDVFAAERPPLEKRRFAIASVRRHRPYTLSAKEEEMLGATAPNNDWPDQLYDILRERAPVIAVNGTDPRAREEAFKRSYAAQATQRDLYAFALMRLADIRTRLARLRHFPDAASEAYFDSYWSRSQIDDLMERLAKRADLYKRYQRLRADHARKLAGSEERNVWDLPLRPAGFAPRRFTIDEASEILRRALAPLGPDYGQELAGLLDPANGRMDVVPGERRKRGGFSKGFVGTDSVFYSQGFAGSYNDVRVLAHESTHAVHRQLMNRNSVLPVYAEGPHYLFEAFAIFSELLLADSLRSHDADPLQKEFFLEQFLEGKGMEMFAVAPEVVLEHAVYDGIGNGSIQGADDLDALTKRVYARYSIWPERHDELKMQWMDVSLMYEDPFYDVNYVLGALLALEFRERFARDPGRFVPRYAALLKNGFDAPPAVLLKRFLDIDILDPGLVDDACRVLEERVHSLEESYRESERPPDPTRPAP